MIGRGELPALEFERQRAIGGDLAQREAEAVDAPVEQVLVVRGNRGGHDRPGGPVEVVVRPAVESGALRIVLADLFADAAEPAPHARGLLAIERRVADLEIGARQAGEFPLAHRFAGGVDISEQRFLAGPGIEPLHRAPRIAAALRRIRRESVGETGDAAAELGDRAGAFGIALFRFGIDDGAVVLPAAFAELAGRDDVANRRRRRLAPAGGGARERRGGNRVGARIGRGQRRAQRGNFDGDKRQHQAGHAADGQDFHQGNPSRRKPPLHPNADLTGEFAR